MLLKDEVLDKRGVDRGQHWPESAASGDASWLGRLGHRHTPWFFLTRHPRPWDNEVRTLLTPAMFPT